MNISCPNCHTIYDVEASAIPDAGRDVQCSVCQTIWRVSPEQPLLLVKGQGQAASIDATPKLKEPVAKGAAGDDSLDLRLEKLEKLLGSDNVAVAQNGSRKIRFPYKGSPDEIGMLPAEDMAGVVERPDLAQIFNPDDFLIHEDGGVDAVADAEIVSLDTDESVVSFMGMKSRLNLSFVDEPDAPSQAAQNAAPEASKGNAAPEQVAQEQVAPEPAPQDNPLLKGAKRRKARARAVAEAERRGEQQNSIADEDYISDAVERLSEQVHRPPEPVVEEEAVEALRNEAARASEGADASFVEPAYVEAPRAERSLKIVKQAPHAAPAPDVSASPRNQRMPEPPRIRNDVAAAAAAKEVAVMPNVDENIPPALRRKGADRQRELHTLPPETMREKRRETAKAARSATPASAAKKPAGGKSRATAFWTGFYFVFTFFALLIGLRYLAEPLGQTVPAIDDILVSYSTIFDDTVVRVNDWIDSV